MHTMVGTLSSANAVFNDPHYQASAHFGIAEDGSCWQWGPIGKGWIAWHCASGNGAWYGVEHADNGNPNNPLTDAQLTASAQIVECLSAFAGFPLQEANSPSERGYGVHYMGGAAFGGHTCPDLPPNHVRSAQRPEIIRRARAIRGGPAPAPPPVPPPAAAKEDAVFIALPHADRVVLAPWGAPGQSSPYSHLSLVLAGETGAQVTVTIWRGSEPFTHVHNLTSGTAQGGDPVNGWAGVTMVTLARTDTSAVQASAVLNRW
jgi:hypothetical protein